MTWRDTRWIARYRTVVGDWSSKRLPTSIKQTQEGAAREWISIWYARYLADGGELPDASEVRVTNRVSLADVHDRWMEYRRRDRGTDPSYAKSLGSQYRTWIGSHAISRLNINTEIGHLQILNWLRTVDGAASTRLTIASTLSVMLSDAILHGDAWGVSEDLAHPMLRSVHVVKQLEALRAQRGAERVRAIFTREQVAAILTEQTSKVIDARRVKYALRLQTGIRELEAQGLIWSDVKDLPIPHVWIRRQLVRPGPLPFALLVDLRKKHGAKFDIMKATTAVMKPPKKNSNRALPLRPLIVAALKWWRSTGWQQFTGRAPTDDDPIFPSGLRNSHQAYGQFCAPVAGHMVLLDLERLGLAREYTSATSGLVAEHSSRSFRHTFASLLSEVGVDDGRIGDLLGHRAESVTREHYIETVLAGRAEAIAKLPLPDRLVLAATEVLDPSRPLAVPARVVDLASAVPRRGDRLQKSGK